MGMTKFESIQKAKQAKLEYRMGKSIRQIASELGVSFTTAWRWVNRTEIRGISIENEAEKNL